MQGIADGPRSLRSSGCGAQCLVADHRAARDFAQLGQNFFLKRTGRQSQVDIPAQRIRVAVEIAANLGADFFDALAILDQDPM